jgi:hypothetical protein
MFLRSRTTPTPSPRLSFYAFSERALKPALMPASLLAIYLNDHFAGATAAISLTQRALRENRNNELGTFLAQKLLPELREDRRTLAELMDRLAVRRSIPKTAAAWVAEKLGRLKLNGQLIGYSPLSRLLELEILAIGIEGKRALWLVLAEIRQRDERLRENDLEHLVQRAVSQREGLEPHRLAAATLAFC